MSVKGIAAVVREFKKPLQIEEMTFADPKPTEVLVKITATGICHTDLHAIDGDWPIKPSLPFVPGHEGVGVVVKIGALVNHVKEGDRVGLPWIREACGACEWCISGWETLCPLAVYGGYTSNGSFGQYVVAPGAYVIPIPDDLSDTVAAPILCAGVTTWKAIKETEARSGDWIAVSGIGGLGHLAVRYAKAMGMHVAAIDVADDKLDLARSIGADLVIDARTSDPAAVAQKEFQGAHGVVITAPSQIAFQQGLGVTRRKGTCVLVGLPPADLPAPIFDIVMKRITIRGSLVGTRTDLAEALSFAGQMNIAPHITVRPFAEINPSIEELAQGKVKGRIVVAFD